MKDLAVLIPAYNEGTSLLETLNSIREPDNRFTVYVVDDGSREPVSIECDRYPFAVRVLRQASNGGIVNALNAGVERIRRDGFELVARLDAADANRPSRFAIQYAHLQEHPEVAMVGSNVVFRDEETGEPIFTTNLPLREDEIRRWMAFRNCCIHPAVMLRVGVLEQVGGYESTYPHIEDYVLFSRIAENHRVENLGTPLVECTIRSGGISLRNRRRQALSGLRFKLEHPRPLDPLWYACLGKRLGYLIVPQGVGHRLKRMLGFTTAGASSPSQPGGDAGDLESRGRRTKKVRSSV